ncbi:MAG: TIGR01212 family radical SAM protein [Shewanella sp.]|nr:TIGR01212 family radical SAM protein [Shewanella sp.]MCF1457779.1 TIGR01212 family radical SAM protein [Shewanella sp.]
MGLDKYANTFGAVCKAKYGSKVKKLTIDAKFTCPNRDGTLGKGGCTFCNVASFSHEMGSPLSIAEQLDAGKISRNIKMLQNVGSAKGAADDKFIAYFQAYTSTYDEYRLLKQRYDEALADGDIVGLHVGTRPDCVPDEVLALLADYQARGVDIWLELGLQSAHDHTLKKINRGHGFAAYTDTVKRARQRGIKVCTHLILGLPDETHDDYMSTLHQVLALGVDGLKIHPLHIVAGSTMAKAWRAGRLDTLTLEQYVYSVGEMIRAIPRDVVLHRVTAYAKKPMLLAPDWCASRWDGLVAIVKNLQEFGGQGEAQRLQSVAE